MHAKQAGAGQPVRAEGDAEQAVGQQLILRAVHDGGLPGRARAERADVPERRLAAHPRRRAFRRAHPEKMADWEN